MYEFVILNHYDWKHAILIFMILIFMWVKGIFFNFIIKDLCFARSNARALSITFTIIIVIVNYYEFRKLNYVSHCK
jgi:hypothetical protein